MAALITLREQWRGLGTELLVRATRGISDGSVLNADSGRALTSARIEDWAGVLSLYEVENAPAAIRASA
jgi:mRNA-degrading endonuclease toxin of MazEF toxin-antitoxin module